MENFTELPESRVFISTDAGSTGLNLQVASILINIDLPWNPAILEQRIARIYRIGQQRNIQIINLVAPSSLEERILSTLNFKTSLFEGILDNGEDSIFLEGSKLDKIMENIASSFATPKEKNKEDGTVILTGDQEEIKPKTSAPTDSPNEAEEEKQKVSQKERPPWKKNPRQKKNYMKESWKKWEEYPTPVFHRKSPLRHSSSSKESLSSADWPKHFNRPKLPVNW